MIKLSEFPPKTVFNDTDLYDCSTNGITSEKVTYLALKTDIIDGLIPPTATKYVLGLADIDQAQSTGTFTSVTGASLNMATYQVGKFFHIWCAGSVQFTAGGTGGILNINMPNGLGVLDADYNSSGAFGGNSPVLVSYNASNALSQFEIQFASETGILRYTTNINFHDLRINLPVTVASVSVYINAQATLLLS